MNELYDYSVQVTLHMPKKLKEAMNERAHDKRMSNSEYIRSLIVSDMGETQDLGICGIDSFKVQILQRIYGNSDYIVLNGYKICRTNLVNPRLNHTDLKVGDYVMVKDITKMERDTDIVGKYHG